jgi:hypothetical protein
MWKPSFFWTFIDISKERTAYIFSDNEGWGSAFQQIFVKFVPNYEAYHSRGQQFSTFIIPRNFGRALDGSGLQQNKSWPHVFLQICQLYVYTLQIIIFSPQDIF